MKVVPLPPENTALAEYALEGLGAQELWYDTTKRMFHYGDNEYTFQDFPGVRVGGRHNNPVNSNKLLNEGVFALGIMQHPIQLPRFTHWLLDLESNIPKKQEVVGTISTLLHEEWLGVIGRRQSKTLLAGMGFTRPGHPEFIIGIGCDFGTVPHGYNFDSEYWQYGIAEYDFHNVDSISQEKILLAGAGALARMCQIETS
jgi:hypothetical protein